MRGSISDTVREGQNREARRRNTKGGLTQTKNVNSSSNSYEEKERRHQKKPPGKNRPRYKKASPARTENVGKWKFGKGREMVHEGFLQG